MTRARPTTLHAAAVAGGFVAAVGVVSATASVAMPLRIGLATIALVAFAVGIWAAGAWAVLARRRRRTDRATDLPNLAALAVDVGGRAITLAVARIDALDEVAATTGPAGLAPLVRRVAERLRLGTGGLPVYRIDAASLAWVVPDEVIETVDDRFAALAAVLRAPIASGGRAIALSVGFGLAGSGADVAALALAGTRAAARAQAAGKRWVRANADERSTAESSRSLLGELDRAISSGALWVAYQPKQDIASGRIVGAEALVRWQHPQRGNIPPDLFVPLLEAHGRAGAMTAHVLDTALADAASWRRIGRPIGVAVNVSATLLTSERLVSEIAAALARHRIPADMLTLEVTESAAIASADAAIVRLQELRELGVRISIDDYGTGQSTMTYLKRFPAGELKIDKSFVQGIDANGADRILVKSTIDLAHALGMKVVAEGVEDAACLERLRAMGCDVAQGWHIGKPMPAENLALMQAWQRVA